MSKALNSINSFYNLRFKKKKGMAATDDDQSFVGRLWVFCWSVVGFLWVDCWSFVGGLLLLVNCWSSPAGFVGCLPNAPKAGLARACQPQSRAPPHLAGTTTTMPKG